MKKTKKKAYLGFGRIIIKQIKETEERKWMFYVYQQKSST
jgi:hypothetical protein